MKPKDLKTLLLREIDSLDRSKYAKCPDTDFTRSRKLPFNTLISIMLRMEGKSMGNELISAFPKASETPSVSAFFQQRSKLKAGVFDDLFHSLVLSVESIYPPKTFNGLRLLAVDGTDIHIPTDLTQKETLLSLKQGRETYNMLHMNALYDLLQRTYARKQKVLLEDSYFQLIREKGNIAAAPLINKIWHFDILESKCWALIKDATSRVDANRHLWIDIDQCLRYTKRDNKYVRESITNVCNGSINLIDIGSYHFEKVLYRLAKIKSYSSVSELAKLAVKQNFNPIKYSVYDESPEQVLIDLDEL